jgi:hypothetical protein
MTLCGHPRRRWFSGSLLGLLIVASGCESDAGSEAVDAGVAQVRPDAGLATFGDAALGAFGFRRDVYPLFVHECGMCHSVNGPYHDIASPDLDVAYGDAVEFADRIVARIRRGNMPPGCVFEPEDCVPAEGLELVQRWISEGSPP